MNHIILVLEPQRFRDKDFGDGGDVLDVVNTATGRSTVQRNPFWLT
jgi:hypothetical protein